MPTIRTTFEPWRDIVVSDSEYLALLRVGLIYTGEPVEPPPAFTDAQYAELGRENGEAALRILRAVTESEIYDQAVAEALAFIMAQGYATETQLTAGLATKSATTHGHALTDANITGIIPVAQLPASTATARGAVELATPAEATTGTDTTRAVTPQGLKTVADTKAAVSHTHAEADVTGLTAALAGKAATGHGHALTDANITGIIPVAQLPAATATAIGAVELATTAEATTGADTTRAVTPAGLKVVADTKAAASHTHAQADVTGLTAALAGKAATGHSHTVADITDFTTAVNSLIDADTARNALFDYLRAGAVNVAQDTRVVVLGSSTAVGGYTTNPEQGVFQRLAARAGSVALNDLGAVVAAQSAAGMKWWTGALGGTTSADYADATKRAKVALVNPHYVFHMIGSNDWRNSVAPATYKANVLAVLNAIESANPNAVNILVQQQGRRDYGPTYAWDLYGTALRELAAANPTRRAFIDTTDYFRPLGVETDNRGGIVSSDLVHMGDVGHRYMANVLSNILGIPSSDDFARTTVQPFPVVAGAHANNALAGTIALIAANYPRTVRLEGAQYVTLAAAGNNELIAELTETPGGTVLKRVRHRTPSTISGAHTVELNAIFYLPPGVAATVGIRIASPSTITVSGTAEYAEPRLIVEPV